MSDDAEPIELEEPDFDDDDSDASEGIWMRGLMMIILALLFALAETVLAVVAVIQFIWMLVTKEKNEGLVEFGRDLSKWLADVGEFQTGVSDDKPFPWAKWRD